MKSSRMRRPPGASRSTTLSGLSRLPPPSQKKTSKGACCSRSRQSPARTWTRSSSAKRPAARRASTTSCSAVVRRAREPSPLCNQAVPTPEPVPLSAMIPWGFAAAASLSNRPTSGVQLFVKPASEAAHCAATTRGGTARPVMTAPLRRGHEAIGRHRHPYGTPPVWARRTRRSEHWRSGGLAVVRGVVAVEGRIVNATRGLWLAVRRFTAGCEVKGPQHRTRCGSRLHRSRTPGRPAIPRRGEAAEGSTGPRRIGKLISGEPGRRKPQPITGPLGPAPGELRESRGQGSGISLVAPCGGRRTRHRAPGLARAARDRR